MLKKILTGISFGLLITVCLFCANSKAEENEMLARGWSIYTAITPETQKVFDQAIKPVVGTKYTPFCVSSQVVAGTNYCFLCLSVTATKEPVRNNVYVEVFVDLDGKIGKPKFTSIPHKQIPGGYSIYEPVSEKDKALLKAAQVTGYSYLPFCVAKQGGVMGGNPKYFCEGKVVIPDPIPEAVFAIVHAQDAAKPKIAETIRVKRKELPYVLDDPKKAEK